MRRWRLTARGRRLGQADGRKLGAGRFRLAALPGHPGVLPHLLRELPARSLLRIEQPGDRALRHGHSRAAGPAAQCLSRADDGNGPQPNLE